MPTTEDDDDIVDQVLSARSMHQSDWRTVLSSKLMTTFIMTRGSVWKIDDNEWKFNANLTRYRIKWKSKSYLHASWETAADIRSETANLKDFNDGLERLDASVENYGIHSMYLDLRSNEAFPPEFIEIERIYDFISNDQWSTVEATCKPVVNLHGDNCSLSLKWRGLPKWTDWSQYEELRDIQVLQVDYIDALKEFFRTEKRMLCPSLSYSRSSGKSSASQYEPVEDHLRLDSYADIEMPPCLPHNNVLKR